MDGNFFRTCPPPHCFMSFHRELNSSPSTEPLPILFCKLRFIRPGQREKPQALAVGISCNPEITTLVTFIPKAHIEIQISCYSFRGGSGTHQLSTLHLCFPLPQEEWYCMMIKSFGHEQLHCQSIGWLKNTYVAKDRKYISVCVCIQYIHTHTYSVQRVSSHII